MSVAGIAGKRILVTGASRGIGKVCVEHLIAAGASVVGIARCTESLASIQREVRVSLPESAVGAKGC